MPVTDTDYESTWAITDNVNNLPADPITNTGVYQGDLVTLILLCITNIAGVTAKLDADGGVTDTDYASLWDVTAPATLKGDGVNQSELWDALNDIDTNITGIAAKLDNDGGVADTDYEATYTAAFDATVSGTGISQYDIVQFLDQYITDFNAILAKLDADA